MPLNTVIEVEAQELWTRSGQTEDVQMDEGICLALVHEWCTQTAKRDYGSLSLFFSRRMPHMHRIFSFQRGFNLVSDSLSRGANYAAYYNIDAPLTENMITRDGRRSGVRVDRVLRTPVGGVVAHALNTMYRGETYLLAFWGVDGGEPWGHVVGAAWSHNKRTPQYFDPNEGLFRGDGGAFGTDVVADITAEYATGGSVINDFDLYRYTKL